MAWVDEPRGDGGGDPNVNEDYRRYAEVAERAAREAGAILRAAYGRVAAREKAPSDLITDADLASQRKIADVLLGAFPAHTLLAEEEGVEPDPEAPWRWIVDPLDGTINFAHGISPWCVSIALEHRGDLVVGVIHVPLTGHTFRALAGGGATLDERPIRVSTIDRLSGSLVAANFPTDFAADAARQLAYFGRFSTGTHSVRRTGSSAWNLAMVAASGFEVCYGTALNPWDVAAGVVLIREASGQVTGLWGEEFSPYRPEVLASNGHVHREALAALAEAWPRAASDPG
ncbi:MAG: inositol monophosphatase [Isosphaeraceae bacterium]|nr:inositol monophosphatase [Isosphaeraceae bacterium]